MAGALKRVARVRVGSGVMAVYSDIHVLEKQLRRFNRAGIPAATARASNRSANKTKTFVVRMLAKKYNFKIGTLKPKFKVSPRARKNNQTVAIFGFGSRIPMIKVKGAKRQGPLGVRFNAGGGSKVHAHTFLATMDSGHKGIFVRTHKRGGRRPHRISPTTGKRYRTQLGIRELTQPSPAHMLTNEDVSQKTFSFFVNDYPIQLRQQLDWEVTKSKGGV